MIFITALCAIMAYVHDMSCLLFDNEIFRAEAAAFLLCFICNDDGDTLVALTLMHLY